MRIMHGLAVEFSPVVRRALAASRRGPVIALPIVQPMIYVAIEMVRPMKPRSCTDKNAASEPFRPVVTVRRTGVRRFLVVAVGANRRFANAHRNLRRCPVASSEVVLSPFVSASSSR